ncbi:MAG: acetylornithine/succinylornithine family transaminase [Oscillospiraceae bacterium]|nr:acetylornithine/succinylornithine family transaminase [Oscillospiraceae bacterium]
MNINEIKQKDTEYVANTYPRYDLCVEKGLSSTCYDFDGKEYIDLSSGIGVNSLGFCDPAWAGAVTGQLNTLQHMSNLFYTSPCVRLAEKLSEITGCKKVFFANSGAEANEGAIKAARKYSFDKYGAESGRNRIITLVNSFHGRTMAALTATGQESFHNFFFPFLEGFEYVNAGNIGELKEKLEIDILTNGSCAAIIIEYIQGEGGVVPLDYDYVKAVAEICEKYDILLIADEVQTGVGRTGTFLAGENYGIKADITTLAKGLGGGLPIGAVLLGEKTADVFGPGHHGTTFGGNPAICAGAVEILNRISDESFLAGVKNKGDYIRKRLSEIDEVIKTDGMGLMLGITLKTKKSADVVKAGIENGVITLTAKEKLRLLPPLNITMGELEKGLDRLINIMKN